MSPPMTCSLCGATFDPTAEAACGACPLQRGCPLVCCPDCGYVTVDAERSRLARLASALLHGRRRKAPGGRIDRTLADTVPGTVVVVESYCPGIPTPRREQLEAYGLNPGRAVVVLQHAPVTVIRVEHTELALESELATAVLVHDGTGRT